MWGAASGRFTLVKSYPICAWSGALGPKRREGDGQVPEGFYEVSVYNEKSKYHLSLGLDYPNESDRILGRVPLGGAIMIHGACRTIGCIPIEDGPIEEVFLAAEDTRAARRGPVIVHVFPIAMNDAGMRLLAREAEDDAARLTFWESLRPAYLHFEKTHTLPRVSVDKRTGLYVVSP